MHTALETYKVIHNKYEELKYEETEFTLKDNGRIAIDRAIDKNNKVALNKIVLILPGITGSSHDIYIKDICGYLLDNGFQPIVINYRGLRGVHLYTPKLYCFASVDDVAEACDHIFNKYPTSTFYAIGISLGASLLSNYVALCKGNCSLKGAVCISPPYDLVLVDYVSSSLLQKAFGSLCRNVLETQVNDKNGILYQDQELARIIRSIRTAKDYNKMYIVPKFKFKTANNYLRKSSWYINNKCGTHRRYSNTNFLFKRAGRPAHPTGHYSF
jgi:predicted alpha/beta-fold hydrolase